MLIGGRLIARLARHTHMHDAPVAAGRLARAAARLGGLAPGAPQRAQTRHYRHGMSGMPHCRRKLPTACVKGAPVALVQLGVAAGSCADLRRPCACACHWLVRRLPRSCRRAWGTAGITTHTSSFQRPLGRGQRAAGAGFGMARACPICGSAGLHSARAYCLLRATWSSPALGCDSLHSISTFESPLCTP